jgi:hypothetical protein
MCNCRLITPMRAYAGRLNAKSFSPAMLSKCPLISVPHLAPGAATATLKAYKVSPFWGPNSERLLPTRSSRCAVQELQDAWRQTGETDRRRY